MMNSLEQLHAMGQSLWYDNIQRSLLENGALAAMISHGDIRGVTSNPAIFHNAIAKTHEYDSDLSRLAHSGLDASGIFYQLAIQDIQGAADLFQPLYRSTGGGDGYVSLEVNPYLAHDTDGTVEEALRLWKAVDRPNLMIKIPATPEGLPAITRAIAAGLNVNVTLIFAIERYAEVIDAYLKGLEQRAASGQALGGIASVASFFVSRVDTKVDGRLAEFIQSDGKQAAVAADLVGKAAIANARLAYELFEQMFDSERFAVLKKHGANLQRPLWASTSTKNAAYRDVIYVEELIGAETVNTAPPQTIEAFRDHGRVRLSLTEDLPGQHQVVDQLESLGISLQQVTRQLESEGVKSFADAFTAMLATIDERCKAA